MNLNPCNAAASTRDAIPTIYPDDTCSTPVSTKKRSAVADETSLTRPPAFKKREIQQVGLTKTLNYIYLQITFQEPLVLGSELTKCQAGIDLFY